MAKATAEELAMHLNAKDDPIEEPLVEPKAEPLATNDPIVEGEPPKKKRGRPFGATSAEKILEESLGSSTGPTASAKPGRKSNAKGKTDPNALAKNLIGIHMLVATMTGIGEAQISPDEAQQLAVAVCGVCDEYDLAISGKTGAAIQLFAAAAMVYGPRVFMFKMRMAQARAQEATDNARDVSPAAGY